MTMLNSKINQERTSERGNVLFLILIAVALFAALSYAVTQSTRSGGGDASRETTLVNAASITQYPASVKTAITRMIVSNSTDPADLLFDPPADFATELTTDALRARGVFYPSLGGGATYTEAPASVMDTNLPGVWVFNAENEIQDIGLTIGGDAPDSTSADIIAFLPDVKLTVCESIHAKLGIATTPPALTGVIDYATSMDNDNPGYVTGAAGGTITAASLDGQPQGCFNDGGTYVYYHVLVER